MTEVQAKKHREVIKRFVDAPEKGIWCKSVGAIKEWNIVRDPTFYKDRIYVTNDEWAEISKQFIDDRTKVEYKESSGIWLPTQAVGIETMRLNNINDYRIKPDEPKFKVGDWVVTLIGNKKIEVVKGITKSIDGIFYYYLNSGTCSTKSLEKWIPKENELAIFWNDDMTESIIAKYGTYCNIKDICTQYTTESWDNVAPLEFINELRKGK